MPGRSLAFWQAAVLGRQPCPLGWQAAWRQSQPQLRRFVLLLSSELAEHRPALLSRQSVPPGDRLKLGWLCRETSAKQLPSPPRNGSFQVFEFCRQGGNMCDHGEKLLIDYYPQSPGMGGRGESFLGHGSGETSPSYLTNMSTGTPERFPCLAPSLASVFLFQAGLGIMRFNQSPALLLQSFKSYYLVKSLEFCPLKLH